MVHQGYIVGTLWKTKENVLFNGIGIVVLLRYCSYHGEICMILCDVNDVL